MNPELNATKEKLEIVSSAVLPHFRIFAGGFLTTAGSEIRSD